MKGFIDNSTGVILAGGENRRMPVIKAFIRVEGRAIIDRSITLMRRLFNEVFIVTNQPELYIHLDAVLLGDGYDVRGPMTGILTALINTSHDWVFVTACDMPFIDEEVIRYLAMRRDGYLAVLPQDEPLFAFYSRRLIQPMERAVVSGRRGIRDFLEGKRVKYISKKEIAGIGDGERVFVNLNTPDDVYAFVGSKGPDHQRRL
jgi:molybdopterin-guanine dinucleotide biosynthesis protein A